MSPAAVRQRLEHDVGERQRLGRTVGGRRRLQQRGPHQAGIGFQSATAVRKKPKGQQEEETAVGWNHCRMGGAPGVSVQPVSSAKAARCSLAPVPVALQQAVEGGVRDLVADDPALAAAPFAAEAQPFQRACRGASLRGSMSASTRFSAIASKPCRSSAQLLSSVPGAAPPLGRGAKPISARRHEGAQSNSVQVPTSTASSRRTMPRAGARRAAGPRGRARPSPAPARSRSTAACSSGTHHARVGEQRQRSRARRSPPAAAAAGARVSRRQPLKSCFGSFMLMACAARAAQ